jgi:hypothetical protein
MRLLKERRASVYLVCLMAGLVASGCSGSPTGPKPPPPTIEPPPPPKPNEVPIITSMAIANTRVDADAEVSVSAVVEDAETPIEQLTYQWSAAPANGEFIGQGRQVRWRAPRQQKTPDLYTLTLLVTEKYTAAGQPAEHKASKTIEVRYNDSPAEVMRISKRFLTELFANFSVSPQEAVQDFADSCPDKANELSDIANNRKNFQILSGTYENVVIDFNPAKTSADVNGVCTFVDIPQLPSDPNFNRRQTVTGICSLTAIYENWRWFLCSSRFRGTGTTPNQLRYRVPGQIVSP